eukprot:COSAG01_NODE_208_length_21996_cov_31.972097_12_plen_164_part_00
MGRGDVRVALERYISKIVFYIYPPSTSTEILSMLFHMSGEGALLTTCSKRLGVGVPGEWICRHRAQPNSSHISPLHGHLGAAVAFGKGAVGGETLPAAAAGSISAAADQLFRDVGDFDTPAEHFSEFCDPSHVHVAYCIGNFLWGRRTVKAASQSWLPGTGRR